MDYNYLPLLYCWKLFQLFLHPKTSVRNPGYRGNKINVKQFVPMLWASSNTTTDVFSSSLETRSAILGSRR